MRRTIQAAVFAVMMGSGSAALAIDPVYTGFFSDLALEGHDPVAYFTEGRPVEGAAQFETEWNGAKWRFSSAENLETFKADPEAYAPQYGGYCAWAVSQGKDASGDPQYWAIVDDKLYINYDRGIQQRWDADRAGFIQAADQKWPDLVAN